MMPAPFNNCVVVWIVAPAIKCLWTKETELDMILILGQVVLIILWMTMEEHYTHESVIFFNGYY